MSTKVARLSVIALLATAFLGVFLTWVRNSEAQMMANYAPVGVASSNALSVAWFHEPSSRRVIACQALYTGSSPGPAVGPSEVKCVAGILP